METPTQATASRAEAPQQALPPEPDPRPATRRRWPLLEWLVLVFFLATLTVWGVHSWLQVRFPFQTEYGEGVVIQFAAMLAHGEPMYQGQDTPPYRACAYAPLYVWLTSLLMSGDAPAFWPGRLLSTLSTLLLLGLAGGYLWRRAGPLAAACGVVFFVANPLVIFWSSLNRVDMMAQALTTLALCLACVPSSSRRRPWAWDLSTGTCLALSLLTKQSFIAAPVAIVAVLLFQDRARAARITLTCLLVGGSGMGFVEYLSHGHAHVQMFSKNAATATFFPHQLLDYTAHYLLTVAGALALATWGVVRKAWRRHPTWWVYAIVSGLLGISSTGRMGGYYNYFLELHLALSVVAALSLEDILRGAPAARWTGAAAQTLVVAQFGLGIFLGLPPAMYSPWEYAVYETRPVLVAARYPGYLARGYETARLQPWLDRARGPILAENVGNVVVLGHSTWMCDPVYFHFLVFEGMWDERRITGPIERQEIAVIVIQRLHQNLRFNSNVIDTIVRNYVKVDEAGTDSIFIPRQRSHS